MIIGDHDTTNFLYECSHKEKRNEKKNQNGMSWLRKLKGYQDYKYGNDKA